MRWLQIVIGLVVLQTTVWAQESAMPLRSFERFELDSENVRGVWLEGIATMGKQSGSVGLSEVDLDVITTGARLALGTEVIELGAFLPYYFIDGEQRLLSTKVERDAEGIGDLQVYGKVMPLRTKYFDLGAGLEMFFPTGDEDDGLGFGEYGFLPYATGALKLGVAQLRAHFGYRTFTDGGASGPFDSYVYGGGVFVPLGDSVALRAECAAEAVRDHGADFDAVSFQPGIDLRVPLGGTDLLLRPTGGIGFADNDGNWFAGGSVAFLFGS